MTSALAAYSASSAALAASRAPKKVSWAARNRCHSSSSTSLRRRAGRLPLPHQVAVAAGGRAPLGRVGQRLGLLDQPLLDRRGRRRASRSARRSAPCGAGCTTSGRPRTGATARRRTRGRCGGAPSTRRAACAAGWRRCASRCPRRSSRPRRPASPWRPWPRRSSATRSARRASRCSSITGPQRVEPRRQRRPGRRPRWPRSTCAATVFDRLGAPPRATSRRTGSAARAARPRTTSASNRSVKKASASSGVPAGYCPTGPLAVGGADEDVPVLVDATPLVHRPLAHHCRHGSQRPMSAITVLRPQPMRACDRPGSASTVGLAGADRRLPRRSVGHQLLRRGDGSRRRVRGRRPGHGRHRGRRPSRRGAPAQARQRPGDARPRRPHVLRGAGGGRRTTPRPGSTPTTGTCSPTRWPACRRETARMLLGGDYSWDEPDDVRELGDLQELELAGLRFVVDHTPGHTEGSVTFRSPYPDARRGLRGDVLRRPAVRRLDRPHRPARRRPPDDAAQPAPPRCCRCADDIVVLPGHGEQTTIGRERATNPFLHDLATIEPTVTRGLDMTDKPTPLSGFPELLPEHRAVERQVIAQPVAHLRAARLRQHRDPRRRAARPALQGRRDRQGDLRPAPAAGRRLGGRLRARPALRPHRAVRALRARARRQARVPVPALPDPAGLARRAAAGGPLPPVHPGRHRRRRPRRAAVPPRRRGGAGDGGGARRAAAAEPLRSRSTTAS